MLIGGLSAPVASAASGIAHLFAAPPNSVGCQDSKVVPDRESISYGRRAIFNGDGILRTLAGGRVQVASLMASGFPPNSIRRLYLAMVTGTFKPPVYYAGRAFSPTGDHRGVGVTVANAPEDLISWLLAMISQYLLGNGDGTFQAPKTRWRSFSS